MASDLQRIVDTISARVARPALIEDRKQRVVVYSEQRDDQLDDVRRQSILERRTRPRVIRWFAAAGIRDSREPLRTPPSEELGLLPRVCIPVYHEDVLLGFIWFVDPDTAMTNAEIESARSSLPELSLALYRENFLSELTSHAEVAAARAVLLEPPDIAERAAEEAVRDQLIEADRNTSVIVAGVHRGDDETGTSSLRSALEDATVSTRRWAGVNRALVLMRGDHAVVVVCNHSYARSVADYLATSLHETLDATRYRPVVGLGGTRDRLALAAESYEEARDAVRIGALMPSLGLVVEWAQLGVYRTLSRIQHSDIDVATIHPGLHRMLESETNPRVLLDTLEAYLDLAGNVRRAAERLQLHRATLYYRLRRIEESACTDLKDGSERLSLHLAVKLARLSAADGERS